MMPAFEAAGLNFKALDGRRMRIRGWVEKRGGPHIDVTRAGQIELIGASGMAKNIMPQDEGK
jgi:hypothetical protein